MKYSLFILFFFLITHAWGQNEFAEFQSEYDVFLKQYVDKGNVRYTEIKKNYQQVEKLSSLIEKANTHTLTKDERKVFFINVYNLLVIKTVTEHYPIKSPMDIAGFFDRIKHTVAGESLTLNEIEFNKLMKDYGDARIHFALVCAAKGCPPLPDFAMQAPEAEAQLSELTSNALLNPNLLRIDSVKSVIHLSELFKWYFKDFTLHHSSLIEYINEWLPEKINPDFSIQYFAYNWALNDISVEPPPTQPLPSGEKSLQQYTPSVLLAKGQIEYKFFSNLYTQTAGFDEHGDKTKYDSRSSYLSSIHKLLYGIHPKFNLGIELWTKSVRIDGKSSSPFKIYRFENNENNRTALSGAGLTLKFVPFRRLPGLSFQSSLLAPLAKDMEGRQNSRPYLSQDAFLWYSQLFYDLPIGTRFQLFFQLAPWVYFSTLKAEKTSLSSPVTVFASYFPTPRWTIYLQNEFWGNYGTPFLHSYFYQSGMGIKYQIIPGLLEAELLYTRFLFGKSAGAGQTYNLGIRLIR